MIRCRDVTYTCMDNACHNTVMRNIYKTDSKQQQQQIDLALKRETINNFQIRSPKNLVWHPASVSKLSSSRQCRSAPRRLPQDT